jgi:DNA polymerase-3 subunit gamma/tau
MSDQRYLVAARKYRPALFKEIVAQEHVTDTLKNAIRLDRLAHAYLFSGPRGVGKTTAARVLAKAINCTTPLDEREDRAEPCRECDSCRAFEDGRSLNIFEIDAASNNKVDDIRELRETVRIPPQGSKKKVYIIDEVHMLSKQAFNALLKTLEEPPPHALFIFATTEPHKVLPTILSRCQRFDFRRIPVPEVVDRLREICATEDITADEESLMLIARKGDGALRDALSAFDQAVSLCGTNLEYGDLAQAMGVVDLDLFFRLTDHVTTQNSAGVLKLVEHVVREGYDLQEFVTGLAEHLRNLLVARSLEDDALIEAAEATRQRYAEASRQFSESDLLRLLMIVGDAEEAIKSSSQPRLKLEMALLKMAALTRSVDLRTALTKIDRLEQMVEDGALPAHLGDNMASSTASSPTASSDEESGDEESGDPAPPADGPHTTAEPPADYTPPASSGPPSSPAADASAHASADAASPAASEPAPTAERSAPSASTDADADEPAAVSDPTDATKEPEPNEDPDDGEDTPPEMDAGAPPEPSDASTEPAPEESAPEEPAPQTGYRDLFGKPALQKKDEASSDRSASSGTREAAPEDAAADANPAESLSTSDGGVATAPPPPTASDSADDDFQHLTAVWSDFVRSVTQERIRVGSCLQHAAPVEVQNGTARVAVPDAFHRRQLSDHEPLLTEHLSSILERSVDQFRFVVEKNISPNETGETTQESDPYERMRKLREKHSVIEMLFDDFGGELVW